MEAPQRRPVRAEVLLAADDPALIRTLVDHFTRHAVEVRACAAPRCLDAIEERDAAVVVIELERYGGSPTISALRQVTSSPVIALIDAERTVDPVEVIDAGADDFLLKPVAPRDLVAKVRAWLRRASGDPVGPAGDPTGALEIDFVAREVRVRGAVTPLPPREFDLLAFLAERPRRAFTRRELLHRVWSASESWLGPATVTEHVRRLRHRIEDDPARPHWIKTVRGVGYRFEPDGDA